MDEDYRTDNIITYLSILCENSHGYDIKNRLETLQTIKLAADYSIPMFSKLNNSYFTYISNSIYTFLTDLSDYSLAYKHTDIHIMMPVGCNAGSSFYSPLGISKLPFKQKYTIPNLSLILHSQVAALISSTSKSCRYLITKPNYYMLKILYETVPNAKHNMHIGTIEDIEYLQEHDCESKHITDFITCDYFKSQKPVISIKDNKCIIFENDNIIEVITKDQEPIYTMATNIYNGQYIVAIDINSLISLYN